EVDVLVGRIVRHDVVEGVPAEADPDEARGDLGDVEDGEDGLLAGRTCTAGGSVLCGGQVRPLCKGSFRSGGPRRGTGGPPRRRMSVRPTLSVPAAGSPGASPALGPRPATVAAEALAALGG